MRNAKLIELIRDSQIWFVRKPVAGYKWLAIKKGSNVFIFTDGELNLQLRELAKKRQLHIIGRRRDMLHLLKSWHKKNSNCDIQSNKGDNNGR